MTESVEKMRAKERFINSQHESLREEYRKVRKKSRNKNSRVKPLAG